MPATEARLARAARSVRGDRPFVTLSYAQSLDGCLARRPGEPLALSGARSAAMTHRLRAAHDAILVGIGTVLADDPRLTVRLAPGADPRPVVLDTRLRCPPGARLLQANSRAWIACGTGADGARREALESAGAQVLCLPLDARGRVDLDALLARLREQGVERLMVEGGAQVITSFLSARRVDHVVITLAPVFVGGLHATAAPLPLARLRQPCYERIGDDLVVSGALAWSDA